MTLTALLQYKTFEPPVTCSQSFFPVSSPQPPPLPPFSPSLGTIRPPSCAPPPHPRQFPRHSAHIYWGGGVWPWTQLASDGLLYSRVVLTTLIPLLECTQCYCAAHTAKLAVGGMHGWRDTSLASLLRYRYIIIYIRHGTSPRIRGSPRSP